jgi:hypothetical protein
MVTPIIKRADDFLHSTEQPLDERPAALVFGMGRE